MNMVEYLLAKITYYRLANLFENKGVEIVSDAFKEKNNDDNHGQ